MRLATIGRALVPLVCTLACLIIAVGPSMAQQGPAGLTAPRLLLPFDANAAPCAPPAGLTRVLAFAQDNEREFMDGVARGLAAAARDRRLEFRLAQARNDGARQIEQVQQFRAARVGALVHLPPLQPARLPALTFSRPGHTCSVHL